MARIIGQVMAGMPLSTMANQKEPISSLILSKKSLGNLTPNEKAVIETKYKSPRIADMQPIEVAKISKRLLLKIHVITGWSIPADEIMLLFQEQFEKKVAEDYGSLNADEIEFAFRSESMSAQDWGKQMNLQLIDSVLAKYMTNRRLLSEVEEKVKERPAESFEQKMWRLWSLQKVINKLPSTIKRVKQWRRKKK